MSLDLDPRQRAMLQEMGIAVWAPVAREVPPSSAPATALPAAAAMAAPAAPITARAAEPPAAPGGMPKPAAVPTAAHTPAAAPAGAGVASAAAATPSLVLHPPVAVYPSADPAGTPAELGAGWLVVLESATPAEPLAGDAGKLLDNMLRAMRLHRHPRTRVATLERPQPGSSSAASGAEPAAALAHALATARPAMVLLLGLGAARAVLGSREPLGRLRAGVHQITAPDGTPVPAVVSYDPAYLLRAPDAKAAAWADLCRALALVRSAAGTA